MFFVVVVVVVVVVESLSHVPLFCDPMDCSLPGSSIHGDSPGKDTGVDCHFFLHFLKISYFIDFNISIKRDFI